MNIFYLHQDPKVAAISMTNRHVVKMILESAQMLCTAHRFLDGTFQMVFKESNRKVNADGSVKVYRSFVMPDPIVEEQLYKLAHLNHPSTVWVRENASHYMWLYNHMIELGQEYTRRYGKEHATIKKLGNILATPPKNISHKKFIDPPCCMPDQYKTGDSIGSYHNYYRAEKLKYDYDLERFNKFYSNI
jgi:hypothetical protein